MNTPMVRDPNAPVPVSVASRQLERLLACIVAHAARKRWRLRKAGEPLCDVDLPDLHAMLVVPPQQIAFEITLRNERALKRYYAARVDYRERVLERNFDHMTIPAADGIKGEPRMAETSALRDQHVVSVHPLRPPLVRIGSVAGSRPQDAGDKGPGPRPVRKTRVS